MNSPHSSTSSPARLGATLLGEPLVHFALAAAALLLIQHTFARPEIVVSPQRLHGLYKDFEARAGRPPTAEESAQVLADHVDEEVMYREALRTGMTQDNRIRMLLMQTMRTSLRPVLPEPTDEELEALRRESPEIYRAPEKLSFEHVTYAKPESVPEGLLEQLRGGLPRVGVGEPTPRLGNPMPPTDMPQLEWIFGPEFSAFLRAAPDGVWAGPTQSRRGVHFVRIIKREPGQDRPLAEIRPKLAAQWLARQDAAVISSKVAEMKRRYRIVLPETAGREG
jgi:hypothetical protein